MYCSTTYDAKCEMFKADLSFLPSIFLQKILKKWILCAERMPLLAGLQTKCSSRQYFWSNSDDKCWVKKENINFPVETPSLTSSSSRGYILNEDDSLKINNLLEQQQNRIPLFSSLYFFFQEMSYIKEIFLSLFFLTKSYLSSCSKLFINYTCFDKVLSFILYFIVSVSIVIFFLVILCYFYNVIFHHIIYCISMNIRQNGIGFYFCTVF